jgi:uncharacterized protein (DUF1015 family)
MAKIFPFKGWRYNEDNIDLFEDVIVPPYDVITREEQKCIIINLLITTSALI